MMKVQVNKKEKKRKEKRMGEDRRKIEITKRERRRDKCGKMRIFLRERWKELGVCLPLNPPP